MKRIIIVCLVFSLLIACVSCTVQVPTPLESHEPTLPETASYEADVLEPTVDDNIALAQADDDEYVDNIVEEDLDLCGGGDYIVFDFVTPVEDMSFLYFIVGYDDTLYYSQNWIGLIDPDSREAPPAYQAIEYFNIPREAFEENNNMWIHNNATRGTEQTIYEDWMIDALYHEDKDEMIRLLLVPTSLYDGERVYHFKDVALLDEAEREEMFDLTEEEWDDYVMAVVERIEDRMGGYSGYWEGIIESLDRDGSRRRRGGNRGN